MKDLLEGDIPEKPDDYELKLPDELPEGLEVNEDFLSGFKAKAKELNLTKEQAANLFEWWNQGVLDGYGAQTEASKKAYTEAKAEVEKAVGKDGVELAYRAIREFGEPDDEQKLKDAKLDGSVPLMRVLAKAGRALGNDSFVGGKPGTGQSSSEADLKKIYPSMAGLSG
jgi:hypothetical protein